MDSIPVHRYPPRYGAHPRVVPLQMEEVVYDGQKLFAVRRPGAPPDAGVLLSPEAVAIAQFFDGTRDLRGVQRAIHQQYGQLLYVERIHELASALYAAGLLLRDGESTDPADDPSLAVTPAVPHPGLRAAVHAGGAYPGDPERLRQMIESHFTHPEGPGDTLGTGQAVQGIVAPHVDLHRGGPVYAHAYKALLEGTDADLFVVFGTAHASPGQLFTLTRRSYDTPLGAVPTDLEALSVLEQRLGPALFADEAVHDSEHSIELQAVYLRALLGDKPFTILPVLCSTLYGCFAQGLRPEQIPEVQHFLQALDLAVAGRKVCFIAAADLSHVGPLYGDARAPTAAEMERIAREDRASLERLLQGDARGFYDHVAPDGDRRRICGLTPVYMLLRATGGAPGRLLKYAQWFGQESGDMVSFAAATIDFPPR